MPGSEIGIILTLDANGAISAARMLSQQLDQTKASAQRAGSALSQLQKKGADLNQGLANIQQGLMMISRAFHAVGDQMIAFTSDALESFRALDTGLARVAITLGMTGDEKEWKVGLVDTFDQITEQVEQIGRDTEFTFGEAAAAFQLLAQSGVGAADMMSEVESVMAFSSASAGTVGLAQAADTATMGVAALGLEFKDMSKVMDMLTVMSQSTKLSFFEMRQMLRSMGAAAGKFSKTAPAQFTAVAAMMRQMGLTAAQSGQRVKALARSIGHTMEAIERGELMGKKSMKGRRAGRIRAIRWLGLTPEMFKDTDGKLKQLGEIINIGMNKIDQLLAEGRDEEAIYRKFTKAFGQEMASDIFIQARRYKKLYKKSWEELVEIQDQGAGAAKKAQERYLKTWEGMNKVFLSSWDRLKTKIGDSMAEFLGPFVKGLTEALNKMADWIKANEAVGGVLGPVIIGGAILFKLLGWISGALSTVAMIMMMIIPLLIMKAGSLTLVTMATLAWEMALLPLLAGLGTLLLTLVGIGAIGYAAWKAFSDPVITDLGAMAETVQNFAKDVKDFWTFVIPALSLKGIKKTEFDKLSDRTKLWIEQAGSMREALGGLFEGIMTGIDHALVPLRITFEVLFFVVTAFLALLARLSGGFWDLTGEVDENTYFMKVLGYVIGIMIGLLLTYRAILVLVAFWNGVTAVSTYLFALKTGLLHKALILLVAPLKWLYTTALPILGFLISAVAVNCGVLVGTVLAVAFAFIGIIGVFWYFWDEIDTWLTVITDGFLNVLEILLLALAAAAGIAFMIFAAPAWAIAGLVLLVASLITWLFGWTDWIRDFFSWVTGGWIDDAETSNARELGLQVTDGIKTGLEEGTPDVLNAQKKLIEGLSDMHLKSPAKTGPLKVHPPKKWGSNIVKDIAEGMKGLTPEIQATGLSMMGELSASITDPVIWMNMGQSVGSLMANSFRSNMGGFAVAGETGGMNLDISGPEISDGSGGSSVPGKKESKPITVNSYVTTGDIKLNGSDLGGEEAKKFIKWVSDRVGKELKKELQSMGLGA